MRRTKRKNLKDNIQAQQASKKQKSSSIVYPYVPGAIWQSIFGFFNKKELTEVASTCKAFHHLIQEQALVQKAPWPLLDYTRLNRSKSKINDAGGELMLYMPNFLPTGDILICSNKVLYLFNSQVNKCMYLMDLAGWSDTGFKTNVDLLLALPHKTGIVALSRGEDSVIIAFNQKHVLEGHRLQVKCLAIMPSGNVVTGSVDKTIRIWNSDNGECQQVLVGHTDSINQLAVLPNGNIVSSAKDMTLRFWDSQLGKCKQVVQLPSAITCLQAFPNGRLIVGFQNGDLWLFNNEAEQIQELKGHTAEISVLFQLTNGDIASGSWDKTLRIWDKKTGICKHELKGHGHYISCAAELPTGDIISACVDGSLRIWDRQTGRCQSILEGHHSQVEKLLVLPNGNVISTDINLRLIIWKFAELEQKLNQRTAISDMLEPCNHEILERVIVTLPNETRDNIAQQYLQEK